MHVEPLRTLRDWLAGELRDVNGEPQGVNEQLQYMVLNKLLDANDPPPEMVKAVLETTRNDWATRGEVDPTGQFPLLVVTCEGAGDWEPQVRILGAWRDAANVPFGIRYLTKNITTAKGEADTWYTLRAIVRSIQTLLLDKNQDRRVRNGSIIRAATKLRVGPAFQQIGPAAVTGGCIYEFALRDNQA